MANRAVNNRQKLVYRQTPVTPQPVPGVKKEKDRRKRSAPPVPTANKQRLA